MTQMTEAERALIEWRCTKLVNQFALYNDANDFEALVSLFTEDGVFARPTIPDQPMVGRAVILEQFKKRPPRTIRHAMVNTVIDVESPTRATGVTYIALWSGPPREPGTNTPSKADGPMLFGAFDDVFVKVGEDWLFEKRQGSLALSAG
jgi:hypothetical protein